MNIYWGEHEILKESLININKIVYAGGYNITGENNTTESIVFNLVKKPNWFHRTCVRFFLGWKWEDKKEQKEKKNLLLG